MQKSSQPQGEANNLILQQQEPRKQPFATVQPSAAHSCSGHASTARKAGWGRGAAANAAPAAHTTITC